MTTFPFRRIPRSILCRMFNEGHYWERALAGEFQEVLQSDGHPSVPIADEPFCAQSQYITYLDRNGNKVAAVHQYLRPDKTIGLSGRPEPKRLLVDGVLYVPEDYMRKQPK